MVTKQHETVVSKTVSSAPALIQQPQEGNLRTWLIVAVGKKMSNPSLFIRKIRLHVLSQSALVEIKLFLAVAVGTLCVLSTSQGGVYISLFNHYSLAVSD